MVSGESSSSLDFRAPKSCSGTFLLILLIVIVVIFFGFFIAFKVKRGNFIDQSLRAKFSQRPILKTIFFLNDLGDYRQILLNSEEIFVQIIVRKPEDLKSTDLEIVDNLSQNLDNKTIKIDRQTIPQDSISDLYLAHKKPSKSNQAKIVIMVEPRSQNQDTFVGETYQDQGIILYSDRLTELTDISQTRKGLELSTILHELGHLLNIEHNNLANCIMSEIVEVGNYAGGIPTEFCPEEKQLIQ